MLPSPDPLIEPTQHRRSLAEAEIARPPSEVGTEPSIIRSTATYFVRRFSSRMRSLNRASACGATRRRGGALPVVKLKPRNLRRDGRSTALLAAFTRSSRGLATTRVTLAMTRSPARRLRT